MAAETPIIVALITSGFAFAGTYFGTVVSQKKTTALVDYRVGELEKKMEKHNNFIERLTCVEQQVKILEKRR